MLLQKLPQFHRGNIVMEHARFGIGYGACLLADDNGNDIGLLGDTDTGTVTQPESRVYLTVGGNWQDAACRQDGLATHDDCAIVKR